MILCNVMSTCAGSVRFEVYTAEMFSSVFHCHVCVDAQAFHTSTLERRLPIQAHPQHQSAAPAQPSQQEADADMVEILIWPPHLLSGSSVSADDLQLSFSYLCVYSHVHSDTFTSAPVNHRYRKSAVAAPRALFLECEFKLSGDWNLRMSVIMWFLLSVPLVLRAQWGRCMEVK